MAETALEIFREFQAALTGVCVVIFICAGLWVAYKVLWQGEPVKSVWPVIAAGLIAAAVPWFADFIANRVGGA